MTEEEIQTIRKIFIVACGSAYHAGVTGKYVIEGIARIPVEVDVASEFRYRNPILEDGDRLWLLIHLLQHKVRITTFFCGIGIPLNCD